MVVKKLVEGFLTQNQQKVIEIMKKTNQNNSANKYIISEVSMMIIALEISFIQQRQVKKIEMKGGNIHK